VYAAFGTSSAGGHFQEGGTTDHIARRALGARPSIAAPPASVWAELLVEWARAQTLIRRSRVLVFFRLPLAIPHLVWVTLWSIAARAYGGDPRQGVWELEQRNHLRSSTLTPGEKLVLPG